MLKFNVDQEITYNSTAIDIISAGNGIEFGSAFIISDSGAQRDSRHEDESR